MNALPSYAGIFVILICLVVALGGSGGILDKIQYRIWRRRFIKAYDVASEGPLVQTFVTAQIQDLRQRVADLEESLATSRRLLEDKMKEHQKAVEAAFAYKEMAQALKHGQFEIGGVQGGIDLKAKDLATLRSRLRNQERSAQALGFTIPTPPQQ